MPVVVTAIALVIHRRIAGAIAPVFTARLRPVITAVTFMTPVVAMWTLVINRLRCYINRLRPYEHRTRLVIDRRRLHINRERLHINRPLLHIDRLGLIDRPAIAHIHHRTGRAHADRPIHVVPCLRATGKTHGSHRQRRHKTGDDNRTVGLDDCLHKNSPEGRARNAHEVIKRGNPAVAYRMKG